MKLDLIATSTFGLEAVVRREVEALGFKIVKTEDGKVTYIGDERGIVKSNLWLRCADRVLIKMGEFQACEFEDLFQGVKGIAWEEWIPLEGNFKLDCSSVKSKLFSIRSCQSVSEKAVIERLREVYGVAVMEKTQGSYVIKVSLLKDKVTVTLDTTGAGLHKRGYRVAAVAAPIKETMAAALINLSFWKKERILIDPCCGSGTIPIEAAMMAMNIAPGLSRGFASEEWEAIPKEYWKKERRAAFEAIVYDEDAEREKKIFAFDKSKEAVDAAIENATEVGVESLIDFKVQDVNELGADEKGTVIITNPPYGERIGDKREIDVIYKGLRAAMHKNEGLSLFIISPDKGLEKQGMQMSADRRRKLYNGNIEACYYQFHGKR